MNKESFNPEHGPEFDQYRFEGVHVEEQQQVEVQQEEKLPDADEVATQDANALANTREQLFRLTSSEGVQALLD